MGRRSDLRAEARHRAVPELRHGRVAQRGLLRLRRRRLRRHGSPAGPYGSAQIEQTFVDFFDDRLGIETEGTDFSGRSDYGAFIANGIPAGGLFTGAEGIKTVDQAAKWGGTAGIAYDPCYHQACDNLGNVDRDALDRNLDAMAWSVGVYAYSTEEINGVPPRAQRLKLRSAAKNKMKLANGYVPSTKAA